MKIRLNEAYETPTWIHVFLFVSHTVTVNGTSISMSLSTPKVIKKFYTKWYRHKICKQKQKLFLQWKNLKMFFLNIKVKKKPMYLWV